MTGSGFHRKCHMAYTSSVSRPTTPKSATLSNHREHSADRDERRHDTQRESSSAKLCYIKDGVQVKEKKSREPKPEEKREKLGRLSDVSKPPTKFYPQRIMDVHVEDNFLKNPVPVEGRPKSTPIKKINFQTRVDEKKEEEPKESTGRMDWKDYHRLSVIHKFMDDLEQDFPSLCTTGVIGQSVEGRKLKILKISNSNAGNVSVWLDAGIHAREWIAPAVNTYIADQITRHFDTMPESIRNKDWYFLPVVNPDGYEYSHTIDRLWRKNRAWHCGQCVGVDLNRNFSLGWGGKGSSDQPNNAFYRGPHPFSEPESSAMRDLFLNSGLKFKVYITLHSFGQIIIFPYACSSNLAPDYVRLLQGATAMSKAIYDTNGNTYKVGISRDVMYGAAGTSNDFSYGTVGIPYCYLIELRDKKHKFKLPKEEIEETGKEILSCIIALMEFVDNSKSSRFEKKSKDPEEPHAKIADANVERIDSVVDRSEYYIKKINNNLKHANFYLNKNSDGDIKWDVQKFDCEVQKGDSFIKTKVSQFPESDSGTQKCEHYVRQDDRYVLKQESEHYEPKVLCESKNSFDRKVEYFEKKVEQMRDTLSQNENIFDEDSDTYSVKDKYCHITDDDFPEKSLVGRQQSSEEADLREDLRVISMDEIFGGILFFMLQFIKAAKRQSINIWKEERSTMDIMVDGNRTGQVAGMLHEREIPYSVAIPDVTDLLEKENGSRQSIPRRAYFLIPGLTMDWKNYHRLDAIYAFMDNLAAEYPYLCQVSVIGKSVEGRDIKMLKISNGNENNAGVWIDGAIHPREWISPSVVTYIADQIVRTFNELPSSVTNKDWYILPVMNPDGYEYTHTHDRMWRKNRARYGECVGVDLNRNFSYGFGEKGDEGSSDDPGNIFYRGPKAFSEPETAAVKRAIVEAKTAFKVFLSFHSYGEVIIFPWGYTSEPCPDYVELLEGGTAMAKAIHQVNGHTYKVGSTKDLMYYAAGTSIDWSYAVTNIPYSYMVELRGKTHRFLLPKEEIITTCVEVLNGVYRLMDFVDRRCKGTDTCPCPK